MPIDALIRGNVDEESLIQQIPHFTDENTKSGRKMRFTTVAHDGESLQRILRLLKDLVVGIALGAVCMSMLLLLGMWQSFLKRFLPICAASQKLIVLLRTLMLRKTRQPSRLFQRNKPGDCPGIQENRS